MSRILAPVSKFTQKSQWSRSSSTLSIREKDTVCFHCANQVAVFPLAGVKNAWIGVPAIHEDISARTIREGANDVQGQ